MARIRTRITELLGIDIPIVQAPMGWIARSQLASAVSNAGGLGIIETSSGELDDVRAEIAKMRDLTDKPFGVNIAQAFVRDPAIVDFVVDQGVRFVTTSAGDPTKYTAQLKDAGLTVFHVVPTLQGALKAVDAGVDGLVVEGGEGGGFKNPRDVASMVLLPLVAQHVDVPIIAAGGIVDGAVDGGRVRPRRRGRADGHAHGRRRPSRPCTTTGSRPSSAPPRPTRSSSTATAGPGCGRCAPSAPTTPRAPGARSTWARRSARVLDLYFGGDMEAGVALTRPGGRPHRRGPPGRRDHRRVRRRLPRGDRAARAPTGSAG